MAPTKRFAKYSADLQKALAILTAIEPVPKGIGKALTLIRNVEKSASKYAGESSASGEVKKPRKLNNYMLFAKENRAKVVAELGANAKVTEVAKRLGELWKDAKDSYVPKKSTVTEASTKKAKAAPKPKKTPAEKKPRKKAAPKKKASFYDLF